MYAAYRTGKDWGEAFPEGLSPAEFIERVHVVAEAFDEVLAFELGGRVRGFVIVRYERNLAWPHIQWCPWASGRNRLECSLAFLREMGRTGRTVLAAVEMRNKHFFEHLCRYGLMKRVGTIERYFPDGAPAAFFQGREV